MRPTLAIILTPLLLAGPVLASPGTLKHAAVEAHRADAQQLLHKSTSDASALRLRASDRSGILIEQTKKTRSDIAAKLSRGRKDTRAMKLTFSDTTQRHGSAATTLEASKLELGTAKQAMDSSRSSMSWLARNLRFAITPKGRAALARYRADRTTHDGLSLRTEKEQQHLDALASKLSEFEASLGGLRADIRGQRARDIGKEAESQTVAEISSLEHSAKQVEIAARDSIRSKVSTYVKGQTAAQRNPLQRAKDGAHSAEKAGEHADKTIGTAKSEIADAERIESMNQLGNMANALTQNHQNDTAKALFNISRTLGDVSSTLAGQSAANWIGKANRAVEEFHGQLQEVSREAAAIGHGTPGVGGTVSQVRANVALVGYVDLVVNLTRFDSILSDVAAGAAQQFQLARASNQLDSMRRNVVAMRQKVSELHSTLGESLHAFDSQTAKIIDEAVGELVKP